MAEIQVERRKKSSATGWAIILVVLVAVLGAGWYFTLGPGATTRADLPGAVPEAPQDPAAPTSGAEGSVTPAPPATP
jgi:hypothetical protein